MATLVPERGDYHLDMVVLGRAGMDLYPEPVGTKTRDAVSFRADLGGSAGNIAVALARLGVRTGLIAPVSADPAGDFVKRTLATVGVDHLTPVGLTDGSRTSLAIAETRLDDCEVVIYRNHAADLQLTKAMHVYAPTLIVTGTALASDPSRGATISALEETPFAVLDLDYRAYTWSSSVEARSTYQKALRHTDLVVGNEDEFSLLADGSDPLIYARSIAKNHKLIIFKMGAEGSIALFPDGSEQAFGVFDVKVLKPFGAGDSFMGGLMSQLLKGSSVADAIRYGSACAALVVSSPGCASAMPNSDQVLALMESQK